MLDRNEMLEDLNRLELALADTYAIVGRVKDALDDALTENTQLILENDKLRTRLAEIERDESKSTGTTTMLKVYNDGFHVCHAYYGKKLGDGESCLLCQEVLYR